MGYYAPNSTVNVIINALSFDKKLVCCFCVKIAIAKRKDEQNSNFVACLFNKMKDQVKLQVYTCSFVRQKLCSSV